MSYLSSFSIEYPRKPDFFQNYSNLPSEKIFERIFDEENTE
ncbi:hypothetical protein [Infirmifilum uzonense]